ncbi:HAD family hydrolase [Streptomyces gobiensis]|uniref:HAD family hydrolase n=1 Tax=Streptomyces gobiensis TaxID=2875706 RepID=UPI001E341A94|nr:HAD family phosphatase [Streptomyces gobiensis]UGY94684.1 HAD family phosphatase [Streptomyces gobiensis]
MNDSPGTAVIFDLDGTLVDSEPNYYQAGRRVLISHGVTGFTWQDHQRFIGIGTRETLATLREEYAIDAPVDQLLREKNQAYLELARASTEVFPEMRKFAEQLYTAGHPMIIASGSSRTAIGTVLAGTGLSHLLPRYVSAEEVERGKPDADVFLEAAQRLGAEPARCVVVEDAAPGAEAARRAGMRCIAVPYLPETADDPAFTTAGLCFPGGQEDFDAQTAYDWL